MTSIVILLIVLLIYGLAYVFYGKRLLEQKIVKADPARPTPAVEKFDGIDYVPANKYVLFGHHFASIAGAGPITGPAIALAWGWFLPLLWVLFGNVFIGAVHDYLSLMASVRHGGVSIGTIAESVMGRRARYVFLAYIWFTLILVLAAFLSVASSTFIDAPSAATVALLYMPLALLFGLLVYRVGLPVKVATPIALVLLIGMLVFSLNSGITISYESWVIILSLYSIAAASLPVWYLLQPRDYLNAYLLWAFVVIAVIAPLFVAAAPLTGPSIITFTAKGTLIGAVSGTAPAGWDIAWFWPTVPLTIACGALSGFHSLVSSGTSSKQLASELDGLLVGYGGMLTEGAVSSLAVILPAAVVWDFAQFASNVGVPTDIFMKVINTTKTPNILSLSGIARFYTSYGLMQAAAWSRIFGVGAFPDLYRGFYTFAAWCLSAFVLTTLDTANRLARFTWSEMFDWVSPGLRKVLRNRWFASTVSILLGALMAYPKIPDPVNPKRIIYAYQIVWPAFAGTNQLLAALALLTSALWVYAIVKVRGAVNYLIMIPALFLWVTVTGALLIWLIYVVPYLPALYIATAGVVVSISLVLDILLLWLFIKGLRLARSQI